MTNAVRDAIVRAAEEEGVDPATALAYAQRESNFNPQARNSKTIRGLFQMRGDLRQQYGVGDSDDPFTQAKGWARFYKATRDGMSKRLGRDVSDAETYAGHHFGEGRASKMFGMDPETPVDQVFTPYERSLNPHFDKAGSVGNLLSSVTSDIDKRRSSFGAQAPTLDLSQFAAADNAETMSTPSQSQPSGALDLSQFGAVA
jgi:hypothetical protein